jgi:hypothetical protein
MISNDSDSARVRKQRPLKIKGAHIRFIADSATLSWQKMLFLCFMCVLKIIRTLSLTHYILVIYCTVLELPDNSQYLNIRLGINDRVPSKTLKISMLLAFVSSASRTSGLWVNSVDIFYS